ncbi:MAG: hypothetical protein JNM17_41205 [Archangium sp.]|nr:hypothetical protein [Archangium sp.]
MPDWTSWLRGQLKSFDAAWSEPDPVTRLEKVIRDRTSLQLIDDVLSGKSGQPLFGAFITGDALIDLRGTVGSDVKARLQRADEAISSTLLGLVGGGRAAPTASPSIWQRLFGGKPAAPATSGTDLAGAAKVIATLSFSAWLSLFEQHEALREALAATPPREPAARQAIEDALAKNDSSTIIPLIRALASLAQSGSVPALRLQLANTRNSLVREEAITALVRCDRNRFSEFATANETERQAAVRGLAGDVSVCLALRDTSPAVVTVAREEIKKLPPYVAVNGLTLALTEGTPAMRRVAMEELRPLVPNHAGQMIDSLLTAYENEGPLGDEVDRLLAEAIAVPTLGRQNLQALKKAELPARSKAALEARTRARTKPVSAAKQSKTAELEPDLEEADANDPAWLIYADALTANGDLRGEAITFASQGQKPRIFLEANADALLGRVPSIIEKANLDRFLSNLRYRAGLIEGADVKLTYDLAQRVRMEDLLEALLAAPAARFVRDLDIGLVSFESDENGYDEVIDVLGASTRAPFLRDLVLGDFDYPDDIEISWAPYGDLSKLWAQLPNVRSLHVCGAGGEFGDIIAPSLTHFAVETGALARQEFESILDMSAPKLEHLEVWFGDEAYGAECAVDDVARLLNALPPKVTSLGLCNAEFTPELIPLLAASPVLKRLKRLDLSNGVLVTSDLNELIRLAPAFSHLDALVLEGNLLDEDDESILEVLPKTRMTEQRERYDDDNDRYVAVGE